MPIPVILVHGLFGDLGVPEIIEAIEAPIVLAPNLLGYGEFRAVPTEDLTLAAQAEHLAGWIRKRTSGPCHIVGHSIGGAVSVLLADRHPELVASLTSVEGNFTLKDAFWSSQIAKKTIAEVDTILTGYKADAGAWIAGTGVKVTARTLEIAKLWLDNQPASSLRALARAAVAATGAPEYLETIRRIAAAPMPFHLISGERSRGGWDVPGWVVDAAASDTVIAGTGHMMMLESPEEFGAALCAAIKISPARRADA